MDDPNMHAYGEDGPDDAEIGRQWRENSSLEKWFPITAERLAPERRADGMPASADERHLRRLLAQRVGMPHTYYDDGEAQGQEHGISIDFMRELVADIDAKLRALNVARFEVRRTAMPQGCETPDGCAVHGCRGECLKTPNMELSGASPEGEASARTKG